MVDADIQALRERVLMTNLMLGGGSTPIPQLLGDVDTQVLYVLNGPAEPAEPAASTTVVPLRPAAPQAVVDAQVPQA